MNWEMITQDEARTATSEWAMMSPEDLSIALDDKTIRKELGDKREYLVMRDEILESYQSAEALDPSRKYLFDLTLGKGIYRVMSKFDMGVRQASHNPIWWFITIKVAPDVVYARWKKDIKPDTFAESRYWKTSMRIYFKQLWWYYHLSLVDGTDLDDMLSKTWKMLKAGSEDTMVQLVERSGRAGFRLDLYKNIISYYMNNKPNVAKREKWFRQAMVYNTFRLALVEPELVEGGIERYVQDIFEYADRKEEMK